MTPRCHNDYETRLNMIEDKLDLIISLLRDNNGIKGFGINVLANVVGNLVDANKR